jgi:hypothetical protein
LVFVEYRERRGQDIEIGEGRREREGEGGPDGVEAKNEREREE